MVITDIKRKEMAEDNGMHAIAEQYGLTVIKTTTDKNGYPKDLQNALVGFDTFEEAQDVAEEYGLRITTFIRKAGHELYYRNNNTTYEPLHIRAEDYGDDYKVFGINHHKNYYKNEVRPYLSDFDNIDDLMDFVSAQEDIISALDDISRNELVIVRDGEYYETIERKTMRWDNEEELVVIGVI